MAFLGNAIGNLAPKKAVEFIATIAAQLRPGEHLLLGADLVKPPKILEAAYDDAAGVTAEFNHNVLRTSIPTRSSTSRSSIVESTTSRCTSARVGRRRFRSRSSAHSACF